MEDNEPDIHELRPKKPEPPRVPQGMRNFTVYRRGDKSGVSGTGLVIQGTLFANGKCAIQWLVGPEPGDTTVKMWESFLDVHVRSHPENKTIITFDDDEQLKFPEE